MQALSCNDLVISAKILLKTLKHLEPKGSSNISVLMSDDPCYDPFVQSVAEVLQLEVLTTIPLQKMFVERYVRTVQCALAPYNDRLDEIVFAFHKMMRHTNRKIERVERGFRGDFESFIQKDFVASHPIEMSTFTADVQPDGTWNILNIQTTDVGGQVLETQNVTKCAAIICNPQFCKVLCSNCPVGSPCLHEYVCSCLDYLQRSCCAHIHVISVLKLDKTRNKVKQDQAPNSDNSKNATNYVTTDQNIAQNVLQNGDSDCRVISNDIDFKDCKTSAFRHLTAALCFIQGLKCSTFSQSLCVNIIAAISRFHEIPINKYRVTKYCTNAEELPEFQRATILVKNEKEIKNRVPIWQEKIDTNEPSARQVEDENFVETNKENNKIPQIYLKQLPSKLLNGYGIDSTLNISKPKEVTKQNRKVLGRNSVRYNLLKEALNKEIHDHCWIIILSEIELNILALANFSETERETLMQKMVNAKSMWACAKCDLYQTSLILGGYVECHVCNSWYHVLCCNNLTNKNGVEVEFDEDFYLCDNCSNLVIIDTQ